jgi:DNA-directed RNA polymerase subunit RPC12/RpoP
MTNYYDASSKLTVGCLIKGTSTPTYYLNIDPNCDLFSWGNADLHTGFTCARCKSGYVIKKVYDDTTSTNYTRCVPSSTFITVNCQDLIVADLKGASLTYKCYSCATGFTKLKTALVGSTEY